MGGIAKGLLGGGGKASAQTSSQVIVPGWLDSKNQSLAGRAETLSNKPYVPYTGNRIADLTADSQQAFGLARGNVGKYNNLMNSASQGSMDLMARANGPTSEQIQGLMNPYIQNVLDISRRKSIEDGARTQQQTARQKGLAGSFGGSRFALRESQDKNNLNQRLQDLQYTGMSDAFNNAQGQFNKGTEALGGGLEALLASMKTGQGFDQDNIMNLLKSGELQRASEQDKLDVNYDDFLREQSWDYDQTNFLANILNPLTGGYKAQESTTTQSGGKSGGGLGQILGMGASIASIFSDERVKENIKDVGKLDNGLTVYSYNYKGDPKTQIGVMAQDVEKKNPSAVTENPDGIKMVDYSKATKDKAEFAEGGRVNFNRLIEAMTRPVSNIAGTSFSAPSIMPQEESKGFSLDADGIEGLKEMFGGLFSGGDSELIDELISEDMMGGLGMGEDFYMNNDLDSSGLFGGMGNMFGNLFAEGGRVNTIFDDSDELEQIMRAQKRDAFTADIDPNTQSLGGIGARKLMNFLGNGVAEGLNIPSYVRSGMNKVGNEAIDIFGKPAAQLDKERLAEQGAVAADQQEAQSLRDKIAAKRGVVAPNAGPVTAAPVSTMPIVAKKPVVPQPKTNASTPTVKASRPSIEGNLLEQYFAPQPVNKSEKKEGGINMPLLMAGLAMMQSSGDDGLISNIADGVGAATSYLGEEKRREDALIAQAAQQRQKDFENMLALMKLDQARDLASMRGAITPYQQRMLDLKSRGLDIQEKKLNAGTDDLIPDMGDEDVVDTSEIDTIREILSQIE